MANEAIARKSYSSVGAQHTGHLALGTNLSLQDRLYILRSETKEAFDEAKSLESRWKDVEREQREVYQVRHQMGHMTQGLAPDTPAAF
jgi:hypothetical protein